MRENSTIHGTKPLKINVVHGGPGAAGSMGPVAKKLSTKYGILEPFQSKYSVWEQVLELKEIIEKNTTTPQVIIGSSWGGLLSLLFAAKHPKIVKKLILIGCGVLEEHYAKKIMPTRLGRLSLKEKDKLKEILASFASQNPETESLDEFAELMKKTDHLNPELTIETIEVDFQFDIFNKVWPEFEAIRKGPELLSLISKIKCPIVAIHGDYDPHPYLGVKLPLEKRIKDFKFILIKDCGHEPWLEKDKKEEFFEILESEIGSV